MLRDVKGVLVQIEAQLCSALAEIKQLGDEVSPRSGEAPKAHRIDPLRWARAAYKARRHRDKEFGGSMFGEPRWDILLDLFIAELEGRRTQVSSACIASAVPATTALRHLQELERGGLIERQACDQDGRRIYVGLTPIGLEKMESLYQHDRQQRPADRPPQIAPVQG